jgi:ElaB/YqjD/DUF883 family membrane-anchored ribosome-binding protein
MTGTTTAKGKPPSTVENEFDTVKDDLAKLRSDISQLSATLKDLTSDTVRQQIETIRTRVDSITGEARQQGREVLDDLTDRIEEKPLASVLIAFGAGLLIGRLLDR